MGAAHAVRQSALGRFSMWAARYAGHRRGVWVLGFGGRGELRSRPIPMPGVSPGNGLLAIKVIGTDEKGRRIAAWAEIDAEPAHPTGKP